MSFAKTQTLDWDDLRVFAAIASGGSLNAASRRLGVNHSTVYRRLNRLEESVGARLFERLPDGYVLTEAGEAMHEHADRIRTEVDSLELRLLGRDHRPRGTVRVTAPDNIAYTYLPRYFNAFRSDFPDIGVELIVGGESLDLSRREADIAVRATPAPPEHLVGRRVCSFAWSFYAAPGYLAEKGRPGDQQALKGHRLIAGEGGLAGLPALRWLERNQDDGIAARCNTVNGMSALAEAGYGIALLPDDQFKPQLEHLFPLVPEVTSDLWILTHPDLRHTERVRLLTRYLWESLRADERLPKTLADANTR